jgi:AraC-like DNA-binding protein
MTRQKLRQQGQGPAMRFVRSCPRLVEAIAELAGFEHPEYLSVAFKREVGLRPGPTASSTWLVTPRRTEPPATEEKRTA